MERETFGTGRVIAASLSVLLLRIRLLTVFAGTVTFLHFLSYFAAETLFPFIGALDVLETNSTADIVGFGASFAIDNVFFAIISAFVILLTYDLMLDRPSNPSRYLQVTRKTLVPVILISILSGIGIGIASMAFVIPGLVLLTVWFVLVPVIVLEGAGLQSFRRSADLTSGYRWPIFGVILLLTLLSYGALALLPLALSAVPIVMQVGFWILIGFAYVLNAITAAVVYARLRELKEGNGIDDLAQVFA